MTLRTCLLALASVALLAASAATPALADHTNADQIMITKKDVPTSVGTETSRDFTDQVIGKTIGICDNASGQTLVSVPAPTKQYVVGIETKNKKTYARISERVYQFETPEQATDSFNELLTSLATCNGTSTMEQGTPDLTQTVTTGSYPGGEYADFWVNVRGTWTGGKECAKPCRFALQAVYVQAGNSITETVAYINGKGRLTSKQSNDLADLAETLAGRWVTSSKGTVRVVV
jgi:hypothetical protein